MSTQPDTLIRRYVDGELAGEELAAFEARLAGEPELRARVAFEEHLRDSVARVLAEHPEAPADLRDRIARTLRDARHDDAESGATDTSPVTPVTPMTPIPDVGRPGAQPMSLEAHRERIAIFRNPTRANMAALAACFAIVTAAVLFGIFGRPVFQGGSASTTLADVSSYVDSEHRRCAIDDDRLARKVRYTGPAHAAARLGGHLRREVPIFDLERLGFDFLGAGECRVPPGQIPSAHLMYEAGSRTRASMVSIFLTPDRGQLPLTEDASPIPLDADFAGDMCLFSDGELVCIVVTSDARDLDTVVTSVKRQLQR